MNQSLGESREGNLETWFHTHEAAFFLRARPTGITSFRDCRLSGQKENDHEQRRRASNTVSRHPCGAYSSLNLYGRLKTGGECQEGYPNRRLFFCPDTATMIKKSALPCDRALRDVLLHRLPGPCSVARWRAGARGRVKVQGSYGVCNAIHVRRSSHGS